MTLSAPAGARFESIELNTGKTPLAFRKSLGEYGKIEVVYNADFTEATITVTVIDPSKVVNGKTYNVILNVLVEGQAANTAASRVTLKMTVKK